MDSTGQLAAASVAVILALIGIISYLFLSLNKKDDTSGSQSNISEGHSVAGASRPERAPASRMRAGARRRRGAGGGEVLDQQAVQTGGGVDEGGGSSAGEEDQAEDEGVGRGREARRAARKKDKQAWKHEKRQEDAEAREAKESKGGKYEERRRQKEAEREEAEKAAAEEQQKAEEARLKEEQEEFDKWKDMFSVEEGGTVEDQIAQESQGLLGEFVSYIESKKTVLLEDLAAHFSLRTQDVIQRITALETMGRLTGVMDDRGKFIYVSHEEMDAVAAYIKKCGRVSIAQLAHKSNEFIDLSPPENTELTEEEIAAMDKEISLEESCKDEDTN